MSEGFKHFEGAPFYRYILPVTGENKHFTTHYTPDLGTIPDHALVEEMPTGPTHGLIKRYFDPGKGKWIRIFHVQPGPHQPENVNKNIKLYKSTTLPVLEVEERDD